MYEQITNGLCKNYNTVEPVYIGNCLRDRISVRLQQAVSRNKFKALLCCPHCVQFLHKATCTFAIITNTEAGYAHLGLSKELHLIRLFKQLVIELTQVVRHCAQLSFIATGGSSQLVLHRYTTLIKAQ